MASSPAGHGARRTPAGPIRAFGPGYATCTAPHKRVAGVPTFVPSPSEASSVCKLVLATDRYEALRPFRPEYLFIRPGYLPNHPAVKDDGVCAEIHSSGILPHIRSDLARLCEAAWSASSIVCSPLQSNNLVLFHEIWHAMFGLRCRYGAGGGRRRRYHAGCGFHASNTELPGVRRDGASARVRASRSPSAGEPRLRREIGSRALPVPRRSADVSSAAGRMGAGGRANPRTASNACTMPTGGGGVGDSGEDAAWRATDAGAASD